MARNTTPGIWMPPPEFAAVVAAGASLPVTRMELAQLSPADLLDATVAALREAELLGVRLHHSRAQLAVRSAEYEQAVALARAGEADLARARVELARLADELARAQAQAAALDQSRAEVMAERDALLASPSWRVTKPLRAAKRLRR